jgi:hypothetical protein
MTQRSYTLLVLLAILFPNLLQAQHMPGIAMGNYAGTQALYHNPAFVADSRYSVHVNLVGVQMFVANNHIKYNADYSFLNLMTNSVPDRYRNERGGIILPLADMVQKLNGNTKFMNLGVEARLPSVMFSLKDGRYGIGLTSRVRTIANLSGVTEPLAQALRSRAKDPTIMRTTFENQRADLHVNLLGDLGLTLGGVVLDEDTEMLKVGATLRRVIGLYNAYIQIDDGSFSIEPDHAYMNQKEFIRVPDINTRYGYTAAGSLQNFNFTPAWLLGNAPAGGGWGLDLGAVYEYRPNAYRYAYTERGVRKLDLSKNKYLYRIAVSLTDIGRIRYNNPNYVRSYEAVTTDKTFRFGDFEDLQSGEEFFGGVNKSLATDTTNSVGSYRTVLPTAFQASVDYQLKPNVYVNALWVQSLRSPGAFGAKAESVLALTPRYETRWYEVSVPVSIMNRYRSFNVGLAGRVGPLWFGTDHLTGLLNIGKPKMFNLYAGLSMGLYRRPPKSPNPCFFGNEEPFWKRLFRRRY